MMTTLAALPAASLPSLSQPKHVLLTVIDDLGFDDLGFRNGDQIFTPTFNMLHGGGVELTSYYVQPSCSPTRAAILTGRKPLHTGINYWLPNVAAGLALSEVTLAEVLNRRGYVSHAVGKWRASSDSNQASVTDDSSRASLFVMSARDAAGQAPRLSQDAVHAHVPRLQLLLRVLRGQRGLLHARPQSGLRPVAQQDGRMGRARHPLDALLCGGGDARARGT